MFIACANKDPPLSVVKISAITDFEATHAKQGYRYRVIPYHSYIYIYYIYILYIYIYNIYILYIYILYISVYTHFPLPKSDCLNESGEIRVPACEFVMESKVRAFEQRKAMGQSFTYHQPNRSLVYTAILRRTSNTYQASTRTGSSCLVSLCKMGADCQSKLHLLQCSIQFHTSCIYFWGYK